MPGSNPSHRDDRLDDEIDSLLRSVEADLEPDPAAAPSAAARAWVRPLRPSIWVRTRALFAAPVSIWVRTRAFFARRGGDFAFYALAIAASVFVGWLTVQLAKP